MLTSKWPVQVRLHIRDLVDAPESEVNQTLKSLNTLVGSNFSIEIAWEDIHRDLRANFSGDMDKLVPAVSKHIVLFLNRLQVLLEEDEGFQDKFLELYKTIVSVLAVVVQAGSKTTCKVANHRLTLQLPTADNDGFRQAQASVGSDLPRLFDDPEEMPESQPAAPDITEEEPDWDTVNIDSAKTEPARGKIDLPSHPKKSSNLKFEDSSSIKPRPLPSLQSLQRPEVLFENIVPAYLTVKGHERDLYIEGTHSPTITLIGEYFKKYARKDMHNVNQSPRFDIEITTSNWGSGTISDCIHIELANRNREWRINVAMFLSFIEGVCGYEMVDHKSGGGYLYKRTTPF